MKPLAAGLIFVTAATIAGLFAGLAGGGLRPLGAVFGLIVGLLCAVATWFATNDATAAPARAGGPARPRYHGVAFWFVGAFFAMFAFRSFCWLYYIDGADWKIQSPNNLGDLALHITYIKTFANGVPLWPDNPIYIASKMRYPAGVDLFNALFSLVHIDLEQSVVWIGLLGSLATFYAFWRWSGTFGVAGFLFNGGTVGFAFVHTLLFEQAIEFRDYQGANDITWKSIPLSMFVTQRGWLYAIPAGLLLLWHWRAKFFRANLSPAAGETAAVPPARRPVGLPFAAELALYASMPLFHVHTFLALSAVLVFLFIGGDAVIRRHVALLIGGALLPATFFVWLISDNFHAHSMIMWHPGWVRNDHILGRSSWFDFWFSNFGILFPLVLGLLGVCAWRAYCAKIRIKLELVAFISIALVGLCLWRVWVDGFHLSTAFFLLCGFAMGGWCVARASDTNFISNDIVPEDLAFLLPAVAIFVAGLLFKFAPWEWDNLKLIVWAYFLVLPFLWERLISEWSVPVRAGVCVALFGSGFVSLIGGLAAGRDGYGIANRDEVDGVGAGVSYLSAQARFATYPTYNHPLLLQGRKVVMGYPGHLWTQGFNYANVEAALRNVMTGAPNWRETARALGVRYLFWGREEKANYPASTRPWEAVAPVVSSGDWGAIYDLEALEPNAPRSLGIKPPAPPPMPRPLPTPLRSPSP